jgi:hypothetical protein
MYEDTFMPCNDRKKKSGEQETFFPLVFRSAQSLNNTNTNFIAISPLEGKKGARREHEKEGKLFLLQCFYCHNSRLHPRHDAMALAPNARASESLKIEGKEIMKCGERKES